MKDIMIDIETFSTNSNGVIVSISAVQFDLTDGALGEEFEIGLTINDQIAKGAVIDGDTVMWWLKQDKTAQNKLTNLVPVGVDNALITFNRWIYSLYGEKYDQLRNIRLWGNGATFDNVLVRNLYKRQGITFAIPYWGDNDVRTAVTLKGIDTRDYKFKGIKHYGIDDCKHQINYITGGLKGN